MRISECPFECPFPPLQLNPGTGTLLTLSTRAHHHTRNPSRPVVGIAQGGRTTPSYVAFTDDERLVGAPAKNQSAMNPVNTVFDAKRLIGRRFDDPDVQRDIKNWPYSVIDVDTKPTIEVTVNSEKKQFSPEEISSMVLGEMKATAEVRQLRL